MFKNLSKVLLIFLTFSVTHLAADISYWDLKLVRAYVHNSDLQRRWAWAHLAPKIRQLKGDERILDIGCGDGKITADVSKFIPQGYILGIDPSTSMLEWAKKQYCKREDPNLQFIEGGFLEPNTSELFDVVISNCALQHSSNQQQSFKNLGVLLLANGKLWVLIPALDSEAKWKPSTKTSSSLLQMVLLLEKCSSSKFFRSRRI